MITINIAEVKTIRPRKRLAVMLETIMSQLDAVSCRLNMQKDESRGVADLVVPLVASLLRI